MITSHTKPHIQVLCCTDNNYAPYTGVMLTSLLENNRNNEIEIWVAATNINSDNEQKLSSLSDIYNCKLHIIKVTQEQLDRLPASQGGWPKEAYLRLSVLHDLPHDMKKVLYLDVDMIVNTNLRYLWETPMEDNAIVAVADINNYITDAQSRLGIQSSYFNSGVMVMELDRCRQLMLKEQCLSIIATSQLEYPDQDALNMVLDGHVTYVSPKWNLVDGYLLKHNQSKIPANIRSIVKSSAKGRRKAIIHYTGIYKPWKETHLRLLHPLRSTWYRYYRKSPWKDTNICNGAPPSIRRRLSITKLMALYRLGIKTPYNENWALF